MSEEHGGGGVGVAVLGDQELYQLLLISKCPLLAMRPANGGGEGERLHTPSRFRSAGAGEYTGGTVVGAEAEKRRARRRGLRRRCGKGGGSVGGGV
jgi:hypothetical protein